MRINRTHTAGIAIFVLVVFLIGLMTTRGDVTGQSAATAFYAAASASENVMDDEIEQTGISDAIVQQVINNPERVQPLPPSEIDSETLWLARVIYSETKRPAEQELVAWVVRNRVETSYRGKADYRSAVLDPFQFSAFNPGDRKRQHYSNLTHTSQAPGFNRAIAIAHTVRNADARFRPFSQNTRHFYSERSMVGVRHPAWAAHGQKVSPERAFNLDERRFRFFADVR